MDGAGDVGMAHIAKLCQTRLKNTQSCQLADMPRSLALGGCRDLDRVAVGQLYVTRSLSNGSVDLDH